MGCSSSRTVRTFYHEALEEQVTTSTDCERGEPEGSANVDTSNKENPAATTVKQIPYVPVDDMTFSCHDTDFSVSEVCASEDTEAVTSEQRELLMQAEDIL